MIGCMLAMAGVDRCGGGPGGGISNNDGGLPSGIGNDGGVVRCSVVQ